MTVTWRNFAACRGMDTALFYPPEQDGDEKYMWASTAAAVDVAKAVCERCPVRDMCLEDALATNERWGIRGGMTSRERYNVQRRTSWREAKWRRRQPRSDRGMNLKSSTNNQGEQAS